MIEIQIDMHDQHRNVAAAHLLLVAGQLANLHGRVYNSTSKPASQISIVQLERQETSLSHGHKTADFIIVQSELSLKNPAIISKIKPDAGVLLNSTLDSVAVSKKYQRNIIALPASGWANMILGRETPDMALLGAFVAITKIFPVDSLEKILRSRFKGAMLERNLTMMQEAIKNVSPEASWVKKCEAKI